MRESLKLTLVTAPARLPVSLNELKVQLRLNDDETQEDALLLGLLRSTVEHCERFTGRALITQTWMLFLDVWPCGDGPALHEGFHVGAVTEAAASNIELPKPPLQSVSHVKTYDDDDVAATWATGNYFVDIAGEPGRIAVRAGQAWPSATRAANAIEIQFVAGYGGDPGNVPEALRHGILMLAAHLYEHRGDAAEAAMLQSGALRLWRPFRVLQL